MLIIGFGSHNATEGSFDRSGKKAEYSFPNSGSSNWWWPYVPWHSHRKLMDFDYNVHILCRRSFDLCLTAHV